MATFQHESCRMVSCQIWVKHSNSLLRDVLFASIESWAPSVLLRERIVAQHFRGGDVLLGTLPRNLGRSGRCRGTPQVHASAEALEKRHWLTAVDAAAIEEEARRADILEAGEWGGEGIRTVLLHKGRQVRQRGVQARLVIFA
jgi:hypothetical protein